MAETVKAEEVTAKEEAVAVETAAEVAETAAEVAAPEVQEAPKTEAAKPAPKKRGRKPGSTTKKPELKVEMILQYGNQEADMGKIADKVKAQFVAEGHRAGTIKTLNIYVKPEDYAAYYVINEKFSGKVDLF